MDLVFVDSIRECEAAHERPVRALDEVIAILLSFLALPALLAADGEDAVLSGDLDILWLEPWELEVDAQVVVRFLDVDGRAPGVAVAREGVVEQPVDLAPESEN